jgi:branched-subunit amino acid ABC-type transport system permease component
MSPLTKQIVTLGLSMVFLGLAPMLFGVSPLSLPRFFQSGDFRLGSASISHNAALNISLSLAPGAYVIGVGRNLLVYYVSPVWGEQIMYLLVLIFLIFLIFHPKGLVGKKFVKPVVGGINELSYIFNGISIIFVALFAPQGISGLWQAKSALRRKKKRKGGT